MNLRKKIINFLLTFLFIIISYTIYYDMILNILSNNCSPIAWGLIEKDNSFLINFINWYKKWENFMCIWYFNSLLKNSELTLTIYILFLWLTVIPFISNNVKLNFKYKTIFFIVWITILILFVLFFIINTPYLKHWFPTVKW